MSDIRKYSKRKRHSKTFTQIFMLSVLFIVLTILAVFVAYALMYTGIAL